MKHIIILITCCIVFAQCGSPKVEVQPVGSFDTLGVHWMTIERKNIFYLFQGSGVKAASIYTDMHEDAYNRLSPVFNAQLPQKIHYFVWTSSNEAALRLGHTLGFAVPSKCVCNVMASQTLGHEMTHVLAYWAGGVPPNSYTRFITEGVAVCFDLSDRDKMQMAKEALAGQNIHSIIELWDGDKQSIDQQVFYPIAGAFMDFMYNQNMPDQFNALLKNEQLDEAEAIYGKERLDSLIAQFNSMLGL